MTTYINILLAAAEHAQQIDTSVSPFTSPSFDEHKRQLKLHALSVAVILSSSRTLMCSSAAPIFIERTPVSNPYFSLVALLSNFATPTFPFIRSLSISERPGGAFPRCLHLEELQLEEFHFFNLRSLTFDLDGVFASLSILATLKLILIDINRETKTCAALILEKLELIGVTDTALNFIFDLPISSDNYDEGCCVNTDDDDDDDDEELEKLWQQSRKLPSLRDLTLEVTRRNGALVSDGVLSRCIERIGAKLNRFELREQFLSHEPSCFYELDRVISALVGAAKHNLRHLTISGFPLRDQIISYETWSEMGKLCPNLSVLDICVGNFTVDPTKRLQNPRSAERANIEGLHNNNSKSLELTEIHFTEERWIGGEPRYPFSTIFFEHIIGGQFLQKFFLQGSSSLSAYFPEEKNCSILILYQNAPNLREIAFDRILGMTVQSLHLKDLAIAENVESFRVQPLDGNVDSDFNAILSDTHSPAPGRFLKKLDIFGFKGQISCSWLKDFAPNLEDFSFHNYGFSPLLYKNICGGLCQTLKSLHMDLEESPTPEIFEEIGKCTKLEFLTIETATESQISRDDEEEYSALKSLRNCKNLVRFDLRSCELPDKILYEMICGEN